MMPPRLSLPSVQAQLAGLDLDRYQDGADDVECLPAGVDLAEPRDLLGVAGVAPDQGHAGDGIERGADFVRHVGQEGALCHIGRPAAFLFGGDQRAARFAFASLISTTKAMMRSGIHRQPARNAAGSPRPEASSHRRHNRHLRSAPPVGRLLETDSRYRRCSSGASRRAFLAATMTCPLCQAARMPMKTASIS